MSLSSKKLLVALAILAFNEVDAFAIPSFQAPRMTTTMRLHTNKTCSQTTVVAPGDSCDTVASRCDISHDDLIRFNPQANFCANIMSQKVVCCTDSSPTQSSGVTNSTQNDSQGGGQSSGKDDGNKTNTLSTNSSSVAVHGARTGNWTKISCDDPAVQDQDTPAGQQWSQLGAPAAFKDAVEYFTSHDRAAGKTLLESVLVTIGADRGLPCQDIDGVDCSSPSTTDCDKFKKNGTGPAGMLIRNSFENIHKVLVFINAVSIH